MIKALKGRQIEFCKNKKCCPVVEVLEDGNFLIGGAEEGYSKFSKTNLQDFVNAAKSGEFDSLIS